MTGWQIILVVSAAVVACCGCVLGVMGACLSGAIEDEAYRRDLDLRLPSRDVRVIRPGDES